jgi:thymidine kinase
MSMEPHIVDRNRDAGWIEVICGSMFSGKTEELIRRLRRARIARQTIESFKPALDDRFSDDEVVSHDENAISTTPVHAASQILLMAENADVIGIDEAQFFDDDLVGVCRQLAQDGKRVLVAGLDQDYQGEPFEPIPQLMAVAEHVTKLHAICVVCGGPANHSQRIVQGDDRVLLGATEAYEPRCRSCFEPRAVEVDRDHLEHTVSLAAPSPDADASEDEDGGDVPEADDVPGEASSPPNPPDAPRNAPSPDDAARSVEESSA